MKLPISIPDWIEFVSSMSSFDVDVTISSNVINGEYYGVASLEDKNFKYKLKIYKNNLVLSFKSDTKETKYVASVFAKAFEKDYSVKYYAKGNNFAYAYEWYWGCSEEVVKEEIYDIEELNCYVLLEKGPEIEEI